MARFAAQPRVASCELRVASEQWLASLRNREHHASAPAGRSSLLTPLLGSARAPRGRSDRSPSRARGARLRAGAPGGLNPDRGHSVLPPRCLPPAPSAAAARTACRPPPPDAVRHTTWARRDAPMSTAACVTCTGFVPLPRRLTTTYHRPAAILRSVPHPVKSAPMS
jgi:hypothetical protein